MWDALFEKQHIRSLYLLFFKVGPKTLQHQITFQRYFQGCVGCPLKYSISSLPVCLCEGDREAELGLPFSPLCDRKSTLVAESQIGKQTFLLSPNLLFWLFHSASCQLKCTGQQFFSCSCRVHRLYRVPHILAADRHGWKGCYTSGGGKSWATRPLQQTQVAHSSYLSLRQPTSTW